MRWSPSRRRTFSLRSRLLGLVALSTAAIVGGTRFFEEGITLAVVEREAVDAASATALGVSAELPPGEGTPTTEELAEILDQFAQAVPTLRAVTVVRASQDGLAVIASTDPSSSRGAVAVARQAIDSRELAVSAELPGAVRLVAVPLERDHKPYGAVVVTSSMEAVERVRQKTRATMAVFAAVSILALTGSFDWLARRLVHQPLARIRQTMGRASAGDLQARAKVDRPDEIGAVADGLNSLLGRVGDFNSALRAEVQRATAELEHRNRQLQESAQRLFAARRELARSEQLAAAGQMAASVAHQIGTPLNLISGYVQMTLEDLPPESAARPRLRTVQEQIQRVTAIVQGLLDQARRPVLHKRRIGAPALVSGVCDLVRPSLDAAGITLRAEVQSSLPDLEVDVGQVEQVFLNLITNSIDAMPEGGILSVAAHSEGGLFIFEVADTGTGIAPEDLERVFDPLFTTKRPGKGTGLGLSIVRDLVAAHDGSVSLQSLPGQGTRVTVRLPEARSGEEGHA